MTGDVDDSDDGTDRLITRRGVLNGVVKGSVGIGAGLVAGGGGLFALGETGVVDLGPLQQVRQRTIPEQPEKSPPETEPENPPAVDDTPWNKDTVVVTLDRADNVAGRDHVESAYQNAVAFWNDYIDTDEPFDVALSFDAEASDPDVEFVEKTITYCVSEYRTPATGNDALTPYVCTETLTDAPDNTPLRPTITMCGGGQNVYELVITHTLGRLLGYDVWSEPVPVMTPKILFGPAHADTPAATSILAKLDDNGDLYGGRLIDIVDSALGVARNPESTYEHHRTQYGLVDGLLLTVEVVRDHVDSHEQTADNWKAEVRDIGFPRYADAYETTTASRDIAYLEDTASLIEDLVENRTQEEVVAADAELDAVIDRLETVAAWEETREGTDVQVHRAWTDAVWSQWDLE